MTSGLKETNLMGVLAPPNKSLHDLIDAKMLGSVLNLGDAGGMFVQCRGAWCAVSSPNARTPFIWINWSSIQPLL